MLAKKGAVVPWQNLDCRLQCPEVVPYFDSLLGRARFLRVKRQMDLLLGIVLILILALPSALIAIAIMCVDRMNPLFLQCRVTQNYRRFTLIKFRTMRPQVRSDLLAVAGDRRVTRLGAVLRKFRLDEIPQLVNIVRGDMTFVGTRPELPRFVDHYTNEMRATLLVTAGLTSQSSLQFREEGALLEHAKDADEVYLKTILPAKMRLNLEYLMSMGFRKDWAVMLKTLMGVGGGK